MKKLLVLAVLIASSCSEKVYTARTTTPQNMTGAQSVRYTQKGNDFHSVMKRTDPDRKLLWVIPYPEFLR